MIERDATYTNGRFDLPAAARGVHFVQIEHRDAGPRPVAVRSIERARSRRFTSFFRRSRLSAR